MRNHGAATTPSLGTSSRTSACRANPKLRRTDYEETEVYGVLRNSGVPNLGGPTPRPKGIPAGRARNALLRRKEAWPGSFSSRTHRAYPHPDRISGAGVHPLLIESIELCS